MSNLKSTKAIASLIRVQDQDLASYLLDTVSVKRMLKISKYTSIAPCTSVLQHFSYFQRTVLVDFLDRA